MFDDPWQDCPIRGKLKPCRTFYDSACRFWTPLQVVENHVGCEGINHERTNNAGIEAFEIKDPYVTVKPRQAI